MPKACGPCRSTRFSACASSIPVIENELRRALEVVASGHDSQKKYVRLGFRGEGKREVKVGYVTENPIWKTSYRIVLDKNGKTKLLGWANVENTSDEDWHDIKLTLVSGRPISFQMDLYPPLFIPRPTVEPELFASLRPPTYSGPMSSTINFGQFGFQGGGQSDARLRRHPRRLDRIQRRLRRRFARERQFNGANIDSAAPR